MFLMLLLLLFLAGVFIIYMRFSKRVPILMYHRIADNPGDRNSLSPAKFTEQLDYLSAHGFHTVSLRDVHDYYTSRKKLPQKPVVLTFDDGYEDNFSVALPLLTARNMTATVFPISAWVGQPNKWEDFGKPPAVTMSWEQLKKWLNAGMEIGSHTVSHPFLSQLHGEVLQSELTQSKDTLSAHLSITTDFLCYPYGDYSDQVIAAAKEAQYKGALAIYDNAPLWDLDLYALPRIPVSSRQPLWEFAVKVSWLHSILIFLRKAEVFSKRLIRKKRQ